MKNKDNTENSQSPGTGTPPDNLRRHPALSIRPRRLRGSPECLNCGTLLQGPYCSYCGQPDKNLFRFFPVLVRDALEDIIDLDSRFFRTMKPLLLHPGKLTRDYLDGRRFRYTPPLRLYLFSSMIFFVLATTLTGSAINFSQGENGNGSVFNRDKFNETGLSEKLQAAVQQGALSADDAENITAAINRATVQDEPAAPVEGAEADPASAETGQANPAEAGDNSFKVGGLPWDKETNPFIISGMPAFINDWINNEIEESPQKGREIGKNPNLIVDKLFDVLPFAVFIMLPLVALLFKFSYLFARKYYVEHLIFALHNHAFLFVVFILTLLTDSVEEWLNPVAGGTISQISLWSDIILICWVPLYLLLSLKTVYRQSWSLTWAKYSLIGISYMLLLALVSGAAAAVSFLLL